MSFLDKLPAPPRAKNTGLTFFIVVSFVFSLFLVFQTRNWVLLALYTGPILAALALFLVWDLENNSRWGTTLLGALLGIAMPGIAGIVYVVTNGLFYGSYEFAGYAQAMVPDLTIGAPYATTGLLESGMNVLYQLFVVAPSEEIVFGIMVFLAILWAIPGGRGNPAYFAAVMFATMAFFAIFHVTAYGNGEGAAGLYASAAVFRAIMVWLYISTKNVGSLIAAHFSHNVVVGSFSFMASDMMTMGAITIPAALFIVALYLRARREEHVSSS